MTVEIRQAGPQDVVAVMPAEVDCVNAAEVREVLLRTLNGTARTLTIDMSATTFCDVAGVRAIERAYRRACACGTRLWLLAPTPGVLRILTLTGIHRIIPIAPPVPAARHIADDEFPLITG
ncbi:MAG TPA: STAS domain-containing protein [Actinoallomurus sp.]|jgi:anti-anti-sigma factor|nr:STAS domain-containing protein [Actinoallomurus sp.]